MKYLFNKMGNLLYSLLLFCFMGGITLGAILYYLDTLLKSEYGTFNLYLIIFVCSFFPLVVGLTSVFYSSSAKGKKKKQKNESIYLKETVTKKPLYK